MNLPHNKNNSEQDKSEIEVLKRKIIELIMRDGGKKAAIGLTNLLNLSNEKKSEKSHYIRKVK